MDQMIIGIPDFARVKDYVWFLLQKKETMENIQAKIPCLKLTYAVGSHKSWLKIQIQG